MDSNKVVQRVKRWLTTITKWKYQRGASVFIPLLLLARLDNIFLAGVVSVTLWITFLVVVGERIALRRMPGTRYMKPRTTPTSTRSRKYSKRMAKQALRRQLVYWKTATNSVANRSSRTISWVKTNVKPAKPPNTKSLVKFYESLISDSTSYQTSSRRFVVPAAKGRWGGSSSKLWGSLRVADEKPAAGEFPTLAGGPSRAADTSRPRGVQVNVLPDSRRPKVDTRLQSPGMFSATDSIWQEMVSTERMYVEDMQLAILHYLVPLEEAAAGGRGAILSEAEIQSVFGSFRTISRINLELLNGLEKAYSEVTDLRLRTTLLVQEYKRVVPFFKMYTEYTKTYKSALEVMESLLAKRKKFRQFVATVQELPDIKGLSLDSFLIKPIQRLLKYPLFFAQLVKETPKQDPGYALLEETSQLVTSVAARVDESTRQLEAAAEEVEVVMRIVTKGSSKATRDERQKQTEQLHRELLAPARRLLINSDCIMCGRNFSLGTVDTKNMKGKPLVFTDLLVLVRVISTARALSYELVAKYDLSKCVVSVESIDEQFPVIAVNGPHITTQGMVDYDRSFMVWFGSIDYREVLQGILDEQERLNAKLSQRQLGLGEAKERRPTNYMSAFWPVPKLPNA